MLRVDMETGAVLEHAWYEYDGPVAMCDRAAQQQAQDLSKGAASTGASVTGGLVPSLQSMANNPQGFGADRGVMENQAEGAGAGEAAQTAQRLKLAAMRSGNYGGLAAAQAGATEGAARATTGALQNILGENARLKAQQQQGALQGEADVAGQQNQLSTDALRQQIAAGNSGWFQNMTNLVAAGAKAAAAFKG